MEATVSTPTQETPNAPTLEEQAAQLESTGTVDPPAQDAGSEENLILGKFKTQEDLEKAYQSLESKLGSGDEPSAKEEPTSEVDSPESGLEIEPQTEQESSNETIQKASNEFWEKGEISQESYDDLAKMGLSKELVDQFASGMQAQQQLQQVQTQQVEQQIFDSVGGKDAYQDMAQWAKSNLSDGELSAFNESVNSGDINRINLAVSGLNAKYQSSNTVAPKNQITGMSAPQGAEAFGSDQEMVNAMSDPRYHNDPSYRKSVDAKVAAMM